MMLNVDLIFVGENFSIEIVRTNFPVMCYMVIWY